MANRRFKQFRLALEPSVVDLFLKVTFAASGVPTLVTSTTLPDGQVVNASKGITSFAQTGTGAYTITLQDNYIRLLMLKGIYVSASSAPAAPGIYVVADGSATLNAPTITIVTTSGGTPTNPASGEAVLLQLVLSNSTAP